MSTYSDDMVLAQCNAALSQDTTVGSIQQLRSLVANRHSLLFNAHAHGKGPTVSQMEAVLPKSCFSALAVVRCR